MSAERFEFQAETARLLKLMAHSVYSEKEVFLRELISNSADACDKLRYEALSKPDLIGEAATFRIDISAGKDAKTLTIRDNGVGMSRADLIDNLGTIARSGTAKFMEAAAGAGDSGGAPVDLIGQFGIGFYSVFIVADRVEVTTRRAGESETWAWTSDGTGAYEIAEGDPAKLRDGRGAAITLYVRDDEAEFLEPARLKHIVKSYSDHVPFSIFVADGEEETQANSGGALWRQPKSELSEKDYTEFYQSVCGGYDAPWRTIHYTAEGRHEYSVLLFLPTMAPFDLYDPARRGAVKLYVKRVAITDDAGLLPAYLRFVRGLVDSQDMPLNLSREMLQNNPIVASIRSALTKRVLNDLGKAAENDADGYEKFWRTFGPVLKEGVYEDFERRDDLLALCRFYSAAKGELISLKDYAEAMADKQAAIYYLHGEDLERLKQSPQLEGYRARGVDVLLMTDPVDGFWTGVVTEFDGKPLKSVTQGAEDLDALPLEDAADETPAANDAAMATLIAAVKTALGDAVCDVRKSNRLTESPVCLAAREGDADLQMRRMLNRDEGPCVLELNPSHALIRSLSEKAGDGAHQPAIENAAHLLLAQAQISAGEAPKDAAGFSRRLTDVLSTYAG
ncbi:MAG: molecular chaperone HtpG [Pseudomonadota bacterium]